MNRDVIQCDDRRLLRLLAASDDDVEVDPWMEHVDQCPECQSRLRELAADDHDWLKAVAVLASDGGDEACFERDHASRSSWNEAMVKRLLQPPSHPEMLGRLGRYEIERMIGSGGMGIVFKAFDTELNRVVAVKLLAPYLAARGSARKRFEREARAAAGVRDDHVVPIFNVESEKEPPFLVMQYVAGGSLQEKIDRDGPLNVPEVLRIGLQTAKGLAAAHAQGLIHRDVKPSNILLDEGVERALLTDFGLARAEDDARLTHSGFQPGTPHYMSPEQVRGEAIDGRSDLFGLGCVLYALQTGHPPFHAASSYAVLRRITDDKPRSIRDINPTVPDWLDHFVMKLLAKSPDDRFDSATSVAQTLEECLAHVQQPATTPLPESVTPPKRNQARRQWVGRFIGMALATLLVVILLSGLNKIGVLQVGSQTGPDGRVNRQNGMTNGGGAQAPGNRSEAPNTTDDHKRPSLEQLIQAFIRHEQNYLPFHVKAMETFRMNEGISAQDRRRYPWADGLNHRKRMEYAQRESGLWLRKEIMLKDEAVQARFEQYTSGEQQVKVSERLGLNDGLQVHLEQDEYQAKMVACTPYAGVFPLSVYSDSLLLSEAIATDRTAATLHWDGPDAVLEFDFGWKNKPMRFRLWLSREHAWHPVKLQRFNTSAAKQYFSEWQATELRRYNDRWRIEKGTIGYRNYEDADKDAAKIIYFIDFEILSAEFGEAVDAERFVYNIPRRAHVHDTTKPKTLEPITNTRPMKVAVTNVAGEPVPAATVHFQSKDGQSIESVVTDDSGVATSQNVPANVLISVSAQGHRAARWIHGPRSNESYIVLAPTTKGTAKDTSGLPVPDALITSQELRFREDGMAYLPRHEYATRENDWSTESGEFKLTTELNVFRRDRSIPVIAVDDSVDKMAITSVPVSQLNQRLEFTLQPICRVEGQFVFKTVGAKLAFDAYVIDQAGHEIARVNPSVRVKDNNTIVAFKLRLPPGRYELRGRGTTSYPDFSVPLPIPSEKRQFNFGSIEVGSSRLTALIGGPAPALRVKTRSDKDLQLSDLKGNVVVLDFWGHWCVPCVRAMPRLMEIAEQFKDRPVRWISVHDASLSTFKELDDRLNHFEKNVWNRKLTLETVIDVSDQPEERIGVTSHRYGVREWPTLVLIGQDSRVVGPSSTAELAGKLNVLLEPTSVR